MNTNIKDNPDTRYSGPLLCIRIAVAVDQRVSISVAVRQCLTIRFTITIGVCQHLTVRFLQHLSITIGVCVCIPIILHLPTLLRLHLTIRLSQHPTITLPVCIPLPTLPFLTPLPLLLPPLPLPLPLPLRCNYLLAQLLHQCHRRQVPRYGHGTFAHNVGGIVGVAIGGVVALVLGVLAIFFLCGHLRSHDRGSGLGGRELGGARERVWVIRGARCAALVIQAWADVLRTGGGGARGRQAGDVVERRSKWKWEWEWGSLVVTGPQPWGAAVIAGALEQLPLWPQRQLVHLARADE
ncbi:hypothetical protein DFH08DRAFT_962224 [Mycena albidolilacea]|uniref:Uncharacterized protein n=1 Tax=Mycena albidolilacea TaxID=1033008 RepID=A0AAD6ZYG2_9AGAR|nr:hypothetical protein DFH08DRAFT_962224 [Mycena albidolilacea]